MTNPSNKPALKTPRQKFNGRSLLRKLKLSLEQSAPVALVPESKRVVHLPEAVATYLLEAMAAIKQGQDPAVALCLRKTRGQPKDEARNLLIYKAVKAKQAEKISQSNALADVGEKVGIGDEAAKIAFRKGKQLATLLELLQRRFGEDIYRRYLPLIDVLKRDYPLPPPKPKKVPVKVKAKEANPNRRLFKTPG